MSNDQSTQSTQTARPRSRTRASNSIAQQGKATSKRSEDWPANGDPPWTYTQRIEETAEKLGIPLITLPKKPINVPFAYLPGEAPEADERDPEKIAWLYPSIFLFENPIGSGGYVTPYEMNRAMLWDHEKKTPVVILTGCDESNGRREWWRFVARGPYWRNHYRRFWDCPSYYVDYYGVPLDATKNDPDRLVRLNPFFFTARLFDSPPIVPASVYRSDWNPMHTKPEPVKKAPKPPEPAPFFKQRAGRLL